MKPTEIEKWFARYGDYEDQCAQWEISASSSDEKLARIEEMFECYPNIPDTTGCLEYLHKLRSIQQIRKAERLRRKR